MHIRIVFVGFGNVGKALARLLFEKQQILKADYGITFSIQGIATKNHGNTVFRNGIDIQELIAADSALDLASLPGGEILQSVDTQEFIYSIRADLLFENTPVNYQNGEPAVTFIRTALSAGMHVITANKGPVVHAFRELRTLAEQNGVRFLFESAVMDGAPIFSLFRNCLPAAHLHSFRGVLNSTTNLILTRMENGDTFDEAVTYCQEIGIAETDPSGDIDGWDAAVKVAALVTVLMDIPLKPDQVARHGIRGITSDAVIQAKKTGQRWKLVCQAVRHAGQVIASVKPELVDRDSPLYSVEGTTSICEFKTDVLGNLSIMEQDPGTHTTAYGLLADFIEATSIVDQR